MLDEFVHGKLIDFGFATRPNNQGLCVTNIGTPANLFPEWIISDLYISAQSNFAIKYLLKFPKKIRS